MAVNATFHLAASFSIPLTLLNSLSAFIGSIANILVITIIGKSSLLNRTTDYLILSLACADLTVTSIMSPLFTYHINFYTSTDGTLFDLFLDSTGYVSNLASIGLMLMVTVDRLVAIRFPFKYKLLLSKFKVIIIIIITLACSLICGVLIKVFQLNPAVIWSICTLLLLGTILSYPYIFYIAHLQERTVIQLATPGHVSGENQTTTSDDNRGVIREKKATKTVAIVVGFFSVCWLPILVYTQVRRDVAEDSGAFLPGFFVAYSMSMLNSTLNPFIYCVRNRRYRKEICKFCCGSRTVVSRTTTMAGAHDNRNHSST